MKKKTKFLPEYREALWTSERPTIPGWYWVKRIKDEYTEAPPEIVYHEGGPSPSLVHGVDHLPWEKKRWDLWLKTLWAGPIPDPAMPEPEEE